MENPVLVEVLRGRAVESRHRGAVAVVDADGGVALAIGDVERPVFPRSAVKAIQALPLVESGAADAFGFGQRELALACASHSGEPDHAALAASMLSRAGLGDDALECGAHWPSRQEAALELAAGGRAPSPLHNNCSGKHAGFLCACRHLGIDHHGYVGADHPAQRAVREAMEAVTGAVHAAEVMVAAVVHKLLAADAELAARIGEMARPALMNWNGIEVGALRPAPTLN